MRNKDDSTIAMEFVELVRVANFHEEMVSITLKIPNMTFVF